MRQKFEYKVILSPRGELTDIEKFFNELGELGWELVSNSPIEFSDLKADYKPTRAVFKRIKLI